MSIALIVSPCALREKKPMKLWPFTLIVALIAIIAWTVLIQDSGREGVIAAERRPDSSIGVGARRASLPPEFLTVTSSAAAKVHLFTRSELGAIRAGRELSLELSSRGERLPPHTPLKLKRPTADCSLIVIANDSGAVAVVTDASGSCYHFEQDDFRDLLTVAATIRNGDGTDRICFAQQDGTPISPLVDACHGDAQISLAWNTLLVAQGDIVLANRVLGGMVTLRGLSALDLLAGSMMVECQNDRRVCSVTLDTTDCEGILEGSYIDFRSKNWRGATERFDLVTRREVRISIKAGSKIFVRSSLWPSKMWRSIDEVSVGASSTIRVAHGIKIHAIRGRDFISEGGDFLLPQFDCLALGLREFSGGTFYLPLAREKLLQIHGGDNFGFRRVAGVGTISRRFVVEGISNDLAHCREVRGSGDTIMVSCRVRDSASMKPISNAIVSFGTSSELNATYRETTAVEKTDADGWVRFTSTRDWALSNFPHIVGFKMAAPATRRTTNAREVGWEVLAAPTGRVRFKVLSEQISRERLYWSAEPSERLLRSKGMLGIGEEVEIRVGTGVESVRLSVSGALGGQPVVVAKMAVASSTLYTVKLPKDIVIPTLLLSLPGDAQGFEVVCRSEAGVMLFDSKTATVFRMGNIIPARFVSTRGSKVTVSGPGLRAVTIQTDESMTYSVKIEAEADGR